jgi:hypothetical protein
VSEDWQGILVTVGIVVGAIGLMIVIFHLRSRFGHPDRVGLAVVVEDPNEGHVLVTSEAISLGVDDGTSIADERLTARRLSDGERIARVTGPAKLVLLGAGPDFV